MNETWILFLGLKVSIVQFRFKIQLSHLIVYLAKLLNFCISHLYDRDKYTVIMKYYELYKLPAIYFVINIWDCFYYNFFVFNGNTCLSW